MLMELAYRLAVEDSPLIRKIRDNVIVLITPVVETDGRDRQIDLSRWRDANPNRPDRPVPQNNPPNTRLTPAAPHTQAMIQITRRSISAAMADSPMATCRIVTA